MSPLKDILHLEQYLYQLSARLFSELSGSEELSVYLDAENSIFVRFNEARIRQSTDLEQAHISLEFQTQGKKQTASLSLSGTEEQDWSRLSECLTQFRSRLAFVPEDPFTVAVENEGNSREHYGQNLPTTQDCVKDILDQVQGSDFVGLFTQGPVASASLNSKGQKHWFSTDLFSLDYSLFNDQRKAVKGNYSGQSWDSSLLAEKLKNEKSQLHSLSRKELKVPRGQHRVYLAPMALAEIAQRISWDTFGLKSQKLGYSPLKSTEVGDKIFSEQFSLLENFGLGMSPRFNRQGEIRPDSLSIIRKGRLENQLVSSRSSIEFKVPSNKANPPESLVSLEILPGQLKEQQILKHLDQGLFISNLHYLNWSDQPEGRLTGMTRYACFLVEKGEIVAPFADLRFDESIFNCFGDKLDELTSFTEDFPSTSTYSQRSLGGMRVPGAIIDDFTFTL